MMHAVNNGWMMNASIHSIRFHKRRLLSLSPCCCAEIASSAVFRD
jgi:hypothetical protein